MVPGGLSLVVRSIFRAVDEVAKNRYAHGSIRTLIYDDVILLQYVDWFTQTRAFVVTDLKIFFSLALLGKGHPRGVGGLLLNVFALLSKLNVLGEGERAHTPTP